MIAKPHGRDGFVYQSVPPGRDEFSADVRWYTFRLPDKRRPVLILTRSEITDRLNEIIVVPVTRTIRGLTTEVS